MKKVYLETKEDIINALAEGREIYREGYLYKLYLCKGYLMREWNSGDLDINAEMVLDKDSEYYYVEENVVDTEDIGKLCWFSDRKDFTGKRPGILKQIDKIVKYPYKTETGAIYKFCKKLTEEELKELS